MSGDKMTLETSTEISRALCNELEALQESAALRNRFQAGFRKSALASIVELGAMVSPDRADEVRKIVAKMLQVDRSCRRACERISAEDET